MNKLIIKRKLKQKEAAKLLGVDQPKISALSHGRLSGFSVERFFRFLTILNQDIEIVIKPHTKNKRRDKQRIAHIYVRYANA
ncbi:MAG: helix-turn-helix transcriptional regulator [Gammaproteobacteria bacterium]